MPAPPDDTKPAARLLGDAFGALASSAVLLPQSMAFGVALLGLADVPAAAAAMAGLLTVAALSLATGVVGGTSGLVAAPTGPTLVLLTGSVQALVEVGLTGAPLRTAITAVVVVTALLQLFIGAVGGGRLIKYIPYPVVSGLVVGSAILMVRSQVRPISGHGVDDAWAPFVFIPVVVAAVTFAVMLLVPRRWPRVPGTLVGLLAGTAAFHGLLLLGPSGAPPRAWVVGALPDVSALEAPFALAHLATLPWTPIVAGALALAVLASLDTLLTSVVADAATGLRHSARKELVGQGLGHVLSGLVGGIAGSGTKGATLAAIASGGRRYTGVFVALVFVLLILFLGPGGALLPVSALAGVVVGIALGSMITRDPFRWLLEKRTREDGVVVAVVAVVTLIADLVTAVGLGVLIAVFLYVRSQARADVIHRRWRGGERHSQRVRDEESVALLEAHGDRIVVCELTGDLFFGTADRLFEHLAPDAARGAHILLDMRRVDSVDLSGLRLLAQLARRVRGQGGLLVFSNVYKKAGFERDVKDSFAKIESLAPVPDTITVVSIDEGLELVEDALLSELGHPRVDVDHDLPLSAHAFTQGLDERGLALVESLVERVAFPAGTTIFDAGQRADELFSVARGEVDLVLPTSAVHHYLRLATCGPGTFFGEISFLEPGPRAARAVARTDVVVALLTRGAFEAVLTRDHEVGARILLNLGTQLGRRLRRADRELRRHAER